MTRTKSFRTFAVVAVLMTFSLAGTAEAGSLSASKNVGSFNLSILAQAWDWVANLWATSTTTTTPQDGPQNTSTSNACTTSCEGDSGWGIDPNGGN